MKRAFVATVSVALLLACAGTAAAQSRGPALLRTPTKAEFDAAYPEAAKARGGFATVDLACTLPPEGPVQNCRVERASRTGEGFEEAAIALTPRYRWRPAYRDGVKIEAPVRFQVRFERALTVEVDAGGVDWVRRPSGDDVESFYPRAARNIALSGRATVQCTVGVDGKTKDCSVLAESPAGVGFGEATIRILNRAQFRPRLVDGRPAESMVRVPFRFVLAEDGDVFLEVAVWGRAPTWEAVQALTPENLDTEGLVNLICEFNDQGVPSSCGVGSERPEGFGLGDTAEKLAREFVLADPDGSGVPARQKAAQIPIRFQPFDPEPEPRRVTRPAWVEAPSGVEIGEAFGPALRQAGLTRTRVVIDCGISAEGRLTGCGTAADTPAPVSAAALAIAAKFRMNPWTTEGEPVEGARIRLPLRYELEAATPAPAN